jgi:broad specificity phosphatase PhoE
VINEHPRKGRILYEDIAEFNARMETFFRRPTYLSMGQETADQAHSRFLTSVRNVLRSESNEPVVMVSHGAVISLLVARANDLDPYWFWSEFRFTSFVVLALPSFALKQVLHAGDARPNLR